MFAFLHNVMTLEEEVLTCVIVIEFDVSVLMGCYTNW